MQAHEASFTFMQSSMKLVVPFFQRSYVWDKENWTELLENLTDKTSSHYLGSIVLKSLEKLSGETPEWSIIDGQQRLTTLSILFKACCNILSSEMKESIEKLKKSPTLDFEAITSAIQKAQIYTQRDEDVLYYKKTASATEKFSKIEHSHVDKPFYDEVINGDILKHLDTIVMDDKQKKNNGSNKILQCYKFFHTQLDQDHAKAEALFNLLLNDNCKFLVKIDLSSNENEQAIFDTVNSAGVRLTSADTIKNAIYQRAIDIRNNNKEQVVELYDATWKKTFTDSENIKYWSATRKIGRMHRDNIEILLHCYALIKGFYEPYKHTIEQLPELYKKHIANFSFDEIKAFATEICEYASIYKEFFFTFDKDTLFSYKDDIKRLFHILHVCEITTFHSYILKLLKDYDVKANKKNPPKEFLEEIHKLETLIIRRVLCGASIKNFNKNCCDLIKNVTTLSREFNNVDAIADDALVKSKMCAIPNNKIATLILFWIELYRANNPKYCTPDLHYVYTLEHVMPQKWQTYWDVNTCPVVNENNEVIEDTIDELTNIRAKAVYEIGNMALLTHELNASIKNNTFDKKIKGEKKHLGIEANAGQLNITQEIVKVHQNNQPWNEYQIRLRSKQLLRL